MATSRPAPIPLEPTPVGLAEAYGVSLLMILAALRNPAIWDVIGGGPLGQRNLTPAGKAELRKNLGEINTALMSRVQGGDVNAAVVAAGISTQLAALAE